MKKRLVSTIIISAMVLAMTGCGKTTEAPADQGAAAQAGSEEAGQEKTYKIALLEKGAEDFLTLTSCYYCSNSSILSMVNILHPGSILSLGTDSPFKCCSIFSTPRYPI